MADNDQNNNQNQKKDNNQQKGLPFYMWKPDADSGLDFIKDNSNGTYDITVLAGLTNPNDKGTHIVIRFVNGKPTDGILELNKDLKSYTFKSVAANANGEIELGFARISDQNLSNGVKVTVPKTKLAGMPVKVTSKESFMVSVSSPDLEWNHSVNIKLFDADGNGVTGEVEITAQQSFEIDGVQYNGRHVLTVSDANGITVSMKALQWNEGFKFTDLKSKNARTEVLLGVK